MGGSSSQEISPLPRGKTVIITGGNTGVGYETAKSIATMGGTVILAVRTEERGKSALQKIDEEYQRMRAEGVAGIVNEERLDVQYRVCDLASLKSTMSFIDWFKATGRSLNVLICNACTYALQEVMTEDKFEASYQVNYLGHFLLVSHLLPILQRSGDDCRVVLVTSEIHRQAVFDVTYAGGERMEKYDGFQCLANCMMFQIMHMYSLDRVLEKSTGTVDVLSVHRGKLDALAFPSDPRSQQGFDCQLGYMKCCGPSLPPVLYTGCKFHELHFSSHKYGPTPFKERLKKELQDYLWKCTIDSLREYLTPDVLQTLRAS